ncbi:MAG: amidohydrolase family protein [Planctomycetota bacterium]
MEYVIYRARHVLPVDRDPIVNGEVHVEDGQIVYCGTGGEMELDLSTPPTVVELGEAALLPGLVNVHTHLELAVLRGYVEEIDFFRWIRKLTRTKYERLAPEELRASALAGALESLQSGVTTVGDIADAGTSFAAATEAGLRAVIYQEVFGPDALDAGRFFDELVEKVEGRRQSSLPSRVEVGVSPHAPYTVSPELFERVTQYCVDEHLPMAIHAAESHAESEFVERGVGPFAEFLNSRGIRWKAPGVSTVQYLDEIGVLAAKPLLVHLVQASLDDIERVARADAAVAHCPKSNAKFGHGVAKAAEMVEAGLRMGVGTDSVVSNNVGDLLDEARHAALTQRARSAELGDRAMWSARRVLELATLGGARALGLESRVGTLTEGKRADLIAIDLSGLHMAPIHDVEAAIVWSANASDVRLTMVDGEIAYSREEASPRVDESSLREQLDRTRRKLRDQPLK